MSFPPSARSGTQPKFDPRRFAKYRTDLALAVYDLSIESRTRMDLGELKARLAHIAGIDSLKVQETERGNQIYTLGDVSVEIPTTDRRHVTYLAEKLADIFGAEQRILMSAIDRIKAKALQARDIAPQAIRDFEADLDGILGEKEAIARRRAAAVAPHHEAIAGIYSELDGLKKAMDILSNDGPPLGKSETDAPGSLPADGIKPE